MVLLKWTPTTSSRMSLEGEAAPLPKEPNCPLLAAPIIGLVAVLRSSSPPMAPMPLVGVMIFLGLGNSTGFLERFLPLFIWRSQYLWPGATSLEHLHFLPSVLLHLPGSGSIPALPQYPDCNAAAAHNTIVTHKSVFIFISQ